MHFNWNTFKPENTYDSFNGLDYQIEYLPTYRLLELEVIYSLSSYLSIFVRYFTSKKYSIITEREKIRRNIVDIFSTHRSVYFFWLLAPTAGSAKKQTRYLDFKQNKIMPEAPLTYDRQQESVIGTRNGINIYLHLNIPSFTVSQLL